MIVNGWFDWAEKRQGPLNKLWGDINSIDAVFFHSAVGTLQGTIDVVMNSTDRSVTGVVGENGHFIQFYSIDKSPWANGSHEWNRKALGFEFAGGYNGSGHTVTEPITDLAVQAAAHILQDLSTFKGVGVDYWQRPITLKEHREVYPTACPSGRIRWQAIQDLLAPAIQRVFLYGNENAGMERRGNQQVQWNNLVEIWAYGDVAGQFPGQTWHNEGGVWRKVAE